MATRRTLAEAIARYGPLVDRIAAQYRNPVTGGPLSGSALLAKLVQGESGGRGDAVSSAGARGEAQFTAGSRQVALQKYGIDPWAGPDPAVHAAALHLLGKINGSTGLAGYNPGDPSYQGYILGQKVGKVAGDPGGTAPVSGGLSAALGFNPGPAPSGAADVAQAAPQPPQTAGLQAPSFSAQAPMPQGATLLSPSMVVPPRVALPGSLAARVGQDVTFGDPSGSSGAGAGGSAGGEVRVAPGANRPGAELSPGILKVVGAVAAQAGGPLTIGTGTNHNRLTVNGNVSDHWSGNAADIPASGVQLTRLGQNALIAAGMDPAQARKQQGGLFNLPYGKRRRIQIIFNTNEGGNHFTHLHVGVTAK